MHIYLVYVALAFTSLVAGSARAFNPNKRQALSDNSSTFHFTNSSTSTRLNSTNMIARSLIVSTNSSADTNHSSSANSTLGVSIWTGPSCIGTPWVTEDITGVYGKTFLDKGGISSFRLSRTLKGREQLDLSVVGNVTQNWCGLFLKSFWPRDSPDGCVDFGPFNCLRIWLN